MDDATAPDVLGLHPDDAARVCSALDLEFSVQDAGDMMWWGWDRPGARVAEQWPNPGSRIISKTVVVRVGFTGSAGGAGVREPRRPSPPPVSLDAEPEDDPEHGGDCR